MEKKLRLVTGSMEIVLKRKRFSIERLENTGFVTGRRDLTLKERITEVIVVHNFNTKVPLIPKKANIFPSIFTVGSLHVIKPVVYNEINDLRVVL